MIGKISDHFKSNAVPTQGGKELEIEEPQRIVQLKATDAHSEIMDLNGELNMARNEITRLRE